jgi:hypothetical protein
VRPASRSLWYRLTPTTNARYQLDLAASNFDTVLAVYAGSGLANLSSVAYNDDVPGTTRSKLEFAAAAGTTYHIAVDGYDASSFGIVSLAVSKVVPANDAFSGEVLTNTTGRISGNNTDATVQVGEPNAAAGNSVWYLWTPASSFPAYLKTTGSNFNTVLHVYTGATLATLTPVVSNDDESALLTTSRVEFSAVANTTYRIQILGSRSQDIGSLQLAWGNTGNENQDLLPDLTVVTADLANWRLDQTEIPGRTLLRLTTATPNTGAGPLELRGSSENPGVMQRIYKPDGNFTERLAGTFTFHPTHDHLHFDNWVQFHLRSVTASNGVGPIVMSGAKTSFAVFDLESHNTSLPGASPSPVYSSGIVQGLSVGWKDIYDRELDGQWIDVTSLPPGQYWLEGGVDPDNHIVELDETNNFSRVLIDYTGTAPPNDTFANATVLTGATVGTDGRSLSATRQSSEPNHAGLTGGGGSIWYQWVAPAAGTTVITTEGSNFDTVLAVYRGSSVSGLTAVASNDNESAALTTSRLSFTATVGTTYRIAVAGKSGATGLVELAINPALNNQFSAAVTLAGNAGTARGANRGANAEASEPAHAGTGATASLWWKLTPSLTGDAVLDTVGSTADTRLAVYVGATLVTLTPVISDDNSGGINGSSRLTFPVTAGVTYAVAVDGDPGAIALNYVVSAALSPTVVTQPGSRNIVAGTILELTTEAVGSPTLTYEWRKGGVLLTNDGRITGANTGNLRIFKTNLDDAGSYQCTVRNNTGTAQSQAATVLVINNNRVLFAEHTRGDNGGLAGIRIMLHSLGNEHVMQFTLALPIGQLLNPIVTPGADTRQATLSLNNSELAQGRLGVMITLPAGAVLSEGLREIAHLEVQTVSGLPNETVLPIAFSPTPLVGRTLALNTTQLSTVLTAGTLTLGPVQEQLTITNVFNGQVQLSLRGIAGRQYQVFTSTSLANWQLVQGLTADHHGEATMAHTPPSGGSSQRFYRAMRQ